MSTINDVARLARVSKATVSRVLSGNRGVKEESRLAVLRAAEMLNYQPNAIAQSLSSQMTHCIGVICASEHIQQATCWLQALEKELSRHGKHLLLRFASTPREVTRARAELDSGLCDALMIVGARFPLPPLDNDVILVDCLSAATAQGILFDWLFAAQTAVQYLCSHQRRDIALINFPAGDAAAEILQGYRQAAENHLIPFHRQRVIEDEPVLRIALQKLINSGVKFNALLVTDDSQAREAVAMLREYRFAVPEQVLVFSLESSGRGVGLESVPAIGYSLESIARQAVALLSGGAPGERVRGTLVSA
ncbi:LacI family DNA-binding transcriptional regulator [Cronobacter sakazakii]|nr:LacI family DNA-binding transcriptional regulator [Cronobacter sakazakii]